MVKDIFLEITIFTFILVSIGLGLTILEFKKMIKYEEKINGRGMQYQAIHVEECITQGLTESPILSLAETVKIMEVMEQIHVF